MLAGRDSDSEDDGSDMICLSTFRVGEILQFSTAEENPRGDLNIYGGVPYLR